MKTIVFFLLFYATPSFGSGDALPELSVIDPRVSIAVLQSSGSDVSDKDRVAQTILGVLSNEFPMQQTGPISFMHPTFGNQGISDLFDLAGIIFGSTCSVDKKQDAFDLLMRYLAKPTWKLANGIKALTQLLKAEQSIASISVLCGDICDLIDAGQAEDGVMLLQSFTPDQISGLGADAAIRRAALLGE